MNRPIRAYLLILAVTTVALALRLPRLQQRPMHCDEAVHAVKFSTILEKGSYRYNPEQYHGPTLYYLTLICARLSGIDQFKNLSEFTLRIVPVCFGVLLVLLLLLLTDGLGRGAAIIAAILTAVSPAFVFYSRYYIQEILLVCFTFGVIACGYRYYKNKNVLWALLAGISIGLCHATKETCIIAFASILMALFITLIIYHRRQGSDLNLKEAVKYRHLAVTVISAAAVSALFYSSFLTNPVGILDSVRSYGHYFFRASQSQLHIHPWYYYLKMLIYSRYASGPFWSEGFIILLAGIGFVAAMTKRNIAGADSGLIRFIAFYTVIMTVIYSAIPYKTPWCLLGFFQGMILLAGVGAVTLVKLAPNTLIRAVIGLLLAAGGAHLTWQSYLTNYRYYADSRNPYVYAHPTTDVIVIAERIKELARIYPDKDKMPIQIICPGDDYWPLPWYLRSFCSVGWWNKIDEKFSPTPVIIAAPSVEPALRKKLSQQPPEAGQFYVSMFDRPVYLRPQVELRCFAAKDLWDRYQQYKAEQILLQNREVK